MTTINQSDTELEVLTDGMLGDQVKLTKLLSGEVQVLIHNPQGGVNGSEMVAATLLSATEIRASKVWL